MEETRGMICHWIPPVAYPLDVLLQDLSLAIARTKNHTPVKGGSRLYGWVRLLEQMRRRSGRSITEELVAALRSNLEGSRTAADLTGEVDGEDEKDVWDFPFRDAFRTLLEARMFVHVVSHLEEKLQAEDWRTLVQGSVRPEDDNVSTPHRDYLLQFYVASVAEAAGMAVELSEPDVVLNVGGQRVGIAVKRIKSRKRIRSNTSHAAMQVERELGNTHIDRGLIFLDVSDLMNRNMAAIRYLRGFPNEENSGSVLGKLMKFASEESRTLQDFLSRSHVEGIILRHAVPAIFAKSFIPGTLETWSPIVGTPADVTVQVLGGMLNAISPPFNPQPGIGASGSAPCEFSFAHPYDPQRGVERHRVGEVSHPKPEKPESHEGVVRVRVVYPNGIEGNGLAISDHELEVDLGIGLLIEVFDVILLDGRRCEVVGVATKLNVRGGTTTITHREL